MGRSAAVEDHPMTITGTNSANRAKKTVRRPSPTPRKKAPQPNASAKLPRLRELDKGALTAASPRMKKKQICIALLCRTDGASIAELQQATGWQAHSVRGFLSGEVRKRMGRQLTSETTVSGERRYRIAEMAAS